MKRTSRRPRRNPSAPTPPYRRIVISEKPMKRFRPVPIFDQPSGYSTEKPIGLWYSCGDEWEQWMRQGQTVEQMTVLSRARYRYELKLDTSEMLRIGTADEFDAFERQYGNGNGEIDWWSVVQSYSGIEICPYRSDRAVSLDESYRRGKMVGRRIVAGSWYDLWDIASGVVWRPGTVKQIIPLGEVQKNRRTSRRTLRRPR
jgi:hypothetical protein